MSDIERVSLDSHVSLCALRYQALEQRLQRVESSLTELELRIREIHVMLTQTQRQAWSQWHRVQWALIGVLGSLVIGGVAHVLLG